LFSNQEELENIYDDLLSYLHAEIQYILLCLKYPSEKGRNEKPKKTPASEVNVQLQWTAQKIDLIEMIYSLFHSKSINNGDVEIKYIVEAFENLFNMSLGKYYRAYLDITRRKVIRPKFISGLLRTIEEAFTVIDRK